MNNRSRVLNSLIHSEAVLASLLSMLIIMRPVVHRSMLRL